MKDFSPKKIGLLIASLALGIAFIVAMILYPPFRFIETVEVEGFLPQSLIREARLFTGLSRWGHDYRSLKEVFETSPFLEEIEFSHSDGVLSIKTEIDDDNVVLTDGHRYILYGNRDIYLPEEMDVPFMRMQFPLIEVSSGQLEYIERFGIEKRLSEVIDLILDIYHSRSYNDKLVGKVKYQSGTGDEFGHLELVSASGNASLHVREKADSEMILKSLSLMKEDERILTGRKMREYELRGNTLTEQKRIVDGI